MIVSKRIAMCNHIGSGIVGKIELLRLIYIYETNPNRQKIETKGPHQS